MKNELRQNLIPSFGWLKLMKIIMVGTSFVGGGSEKVKMVNTFLQSMGHQIEVIDLPGATFADKGGIIINEFVRVLLAMRSVI